jgi:2-C-methyl-D-erythritol 4-phosphate cytidylyltransferase
VSASKTGAIIVAAGRGERMGGIDKLLTPVAGQALVAHSISVFASATVVDELVVVASMANREQIEAIVGSIAPRAQVVLGGERRRDSVRAGLDALSDCEYVVVHDGARPLVTPDLIEAALAGAREAGAALCAVPVTDTVKRADAESMVYGTVSRERLWLAQTPQAFRRDVLLRAHAATDIEATDDATLVELMEAPVRLVMGSARNIKVTTPQDLELVEALIGVGRSEPSP